MKMQRFTLRHAALAVAFAVFFALAGAGAVLAEQVHMQNALNSLQTALTELNAAQADKGGHRNTAIRDVQSAIAQVKQGMTAAK
jgi:hypothetical protein